MVATPSPFASILSFLDPVKSDDGQPYGPFRYKEIVKERYLISKHIHTSYEELGRVTPLERRYLLQFITESAKAEKEYIDSISSNGK